MPNFRVSVIIVVRFPLGSGINGNTLGVMKRLTPRVGYASLWEVELMETHLREALVGTLPVRFPLGSGINGNVHDASYTSLDAVGSTLPSGKWN